MVDPIFTLNSVNYLLDAEHKDEGGVPVLPTPPLPSTVSLYSVLANAILLYFFVLPSSIFQFVLILLSRFLWLRWRFVAFSILIRWVRFDKSRWMDGWMCGRCVAAFRFVGVSYPGPRN